MLLPIPVQFSISLGVVRITREIQECTDLDCAGPLLVVSTRRSHGRCVNTSRFADKGDLSSRLKVADLKSGSGPSFMLVIGPLNPECPTTCAYLLLHRSLFQTHRQWEGHERYSVSR
jgi:hypothetical protein